MNRVVDLTEGKITRNLIIFCIPIFAGLVFQNLYNTVDSIVVGRFVGTDALSAVNVCGNVTNLLVGFFMGLSTGASVVFSRYYSMKSNQKLHDSIHTTVLFTIIFALVVTGIALYFSKTILGYLNCPNEVFDDALNYMRIYLIGVI
ncbi:MAG: MATE family efflux transporter, partial [Traorella sp.]